MEAPFKGLAPAIPLVSKGKKPVESKPMELKNSGKPKMKKNKAAPMLGAYKKAK